MTIASEIQRINNNIASAYTACNNKGATLPVAQDSANLATCIGTIPTGSSKCKQWTYTQSQVSSLGEVITIATTDTFIAQNYNDSTLTISLVPLSVPTAANQALYMAVHSNHQVYNNGSGTLYYGRSIRTALSSMTLSDNHFAYPMTDTTTSTIGGFQVYSNGDLKFKVRDSGAQLYLPACTYLITASIQ